MKRALVILIFLLSGITIHAQTANPNYDEALAKKLGADDYGMKQYVLVILKTGKNTTYKLLDVELFLWYGSAALSEYLPASDKIWKAQP